MVEDKEFFEKKLPFKGYRENNCLIGNVKRANSRVMVGIALTGLVRAEWMIARYGQVIPCNWSQTDALQWLDQYSPIEFLVADARNIIVHHCLAQGFDWLFQIDHDVILPPDCILKLNMRMLEGDIPMWSGLYFTKSTPSEPLIYRGRGTGFFKDWKLGDQVWVDGIPSGCTMIHSSVLKVLADESEEYEPKPGMVVKKVYETPARVWYDPQQGNWFTAVGTEDLELCTRIMKNDILGKAGWKDYSDKEYPFLLDTSLFCKHIDNNGVQYPSRGEEMEFLPEELKE